MYIHTYIHTYAGAVNVEESPAYQAELGLLIVLVIVLVVLVAFVGFMVFKVAEFRKLQATLPLSSAGTAATCMYVCMCTCIHVCMYTCMSVCMYVSR